MLLGLTKVEPEDVRTSRPRPTSRRTTRTRPDLAYAERGEQFGEAVPSVDVQWKVLGWRRRGQSRVGFGRGGLPPTRSSSLRAALDQSRSQAVVEAGERLVPPPEREVCHREQPRRPVIGTARARWLGPYQKLGEEVQSFEVVDVKESADRPGEPRVSSAGARSSSPASRRSADPTPATVATVDVVELQSGFVQKLAKRAVADAPQLRYEPRPVDT